jgi:hypothetical protein
MALLSANWAASGRRSVIVGEVREAMNKSPHVCARARVGERPVSSLVCESGHRERPDCRRQIGIPHILIWGLGGAAAGSRSLQQRDEPAPDRRGRSPPRPLGQRRYPNLFTNCGTMRDADAKTRFNASAV